MAWFSRVISSQQLLCVPAPSQMKFPGEFTFTSSAISQCKLKEPCFVLGAKSFEGGEREKSELYLNEQTKSLSSWLAGPWFLAAA